MLWYIFFVLAENINSPEFSVKTGMISIQFYYNIIIELYYYYLYYDLLAKKKIMM